MHIKKYRKTILTFVFILLVVIISKINSYYHNLSHVLLSNPVSITEIFEKDGKEIPNQFNLQLDEKNNFNYILKLKNEIVNDQKAVLSIGVDYEQIPFFIAGKKENITHIFDINSGKTELTLPISFNIKGLADGVHILTLTLTLSPCKDDDISKRHISYSTRYNLLVNNDNKINVKASPNLIFDSIKLNKKGIILNENYKDQVIKAKPGQKIEIPVLAGGYKTVDGDYSDYIFWFCLNNSQYVFNNNEKHYYFKVKNDELLKKNIVIQVPEQKGSYELVGYVAVNPFDKIREGMKKSFAVDSSNRIVLEVN